MKVAIGYIRVSTDEQNLGPEAQRKALDTWCSKNGYQLAVIHEDIGVSGTAPIEKRPGLLAALDAIAEHHAVALLVAKRDRLARDVVNAAVTEKMAEKNGARVLSADGADNGDGPDAWLMRTIKDAFSQYEVLMIRARTKAALAVKQSKGERTGKVPFGSRLAADGTHLEAEPAEQRTIKAVLTMRREGATLRAIVAELNASNTPARGKRWHLKTVDRLLKPDAPWRRVAMLHQNPLGCEAAK